ncbi:acyl-CoA dehydrogenase family protein [Kitasatospora albolonga]|uniref:acyl-CoA dehydrogenase family protein n=1 Tax=Kitasatospora albolonga TaxID=68173 RepID=UPI003CD0B89E
MLDHRLDREYEELRRTVEQFANDVVAPKIGDYYEQNEFPYEIVREMAQMGLFGLPFPDEYGGMGGDYFAHSAWPWRSMAGSTPRWRSPWSRGLAGARCRSTASHRGAEAGVACPG